MPCCLLLSNSHTSSNRGAVYLEWSALLVPLILFENDEPKPLNQECSANFLPHLPFFCLWHTDSRPHLQLAPTLHSGAPNLSQPTVPSPAFPQCALCFILLPYNYSYNMV